MKSDCSLGNQCMHMLVRDLNMTVINVYTTQMSHVNIGNSHEMWVIVMQMTVTQMIVLKIYMSVSC